MINYQLDDSGIATLLCDLPGRSQNLGHAEHGAALLAAIAAATQDAAVKAILLTSADPNFAGDFEWLPCDGDAAELFARTMARQRTLRQLECCGKPVACALPGSALGPGLELALAAHYRVAADRPKARLGLPEVRRGRLPGGGGTQRLARLIGIQQALPLLLEGEALAPETALQRGLIHALVPPGSEVPAARAWLLAQTGPVQQPWDSKGYKIPGGAVSSPAVQQLFMLANAMLRAKALDNRLVPQHILSCVYEGLITDIDTGLKTEARYVVHALLAGP